MMYKAIRVKCNQYLKKVRDGVNIVITNEGLTKKYMLHKDNQLREAICGEEILKTYFEWVDKSFIGYIVGFQDVVVDAYLGVKAEFFTIGNQEIKKIYKRNNTVIRCAVVYYANNRKRLVPMTGYVEYTEK